MVPYLCRGGGIEVSHLVNSLRLRSSLTNLRIFLRSLSVTIFKLRFRTWTRVIVSYGMSYSLQHKRGSRLEDPPLWVIYSNTVWINPS